MAKSDVRALLFDVFGTCVDWRTSIAAAARRAAAGAGLGEVDGPAIADAWRARYQPQLETVRSGERAWVDLDVLHREALDGLATERGLGGLPEAARGELTRAWHALDPWPDVVPGLDLLRRRFVIAPHSNGHVALLVGMARRAGLPWDLILGAEVVGSYKPEPRSYLRCAELLRLPPSQVMMVAAHNSDLRAAAACGMRTAFIARPAEHGGPIPADDATPWAGADVVAEGMIGLAEALDARTPDGSRSPPRPDTIGRSGPWPN